MSLFDVDIRRLGLQLLPMCLRKPLMGALVYAVTQPASAELKDLLNYRREVNEEMRRNGQTCNLRRMLNDLFDPSLRGITIIETSRSTGVTLGLRADGNTLTTPQTLNSRGYGGSTDLDFSVRLPSRLQGKIDERQVSSVVRRYKLAGKRFGLEYTGLRNVNLSGNHLDITFTDYVTASEGVEQRHSQARIGRVF